MNTNAKFVLAGIACGVAAAGFFLFTGILLADTLDAAAGSTGTSTGRVIKRERTGSRSSEGSWCTIEYKVQGKSFTMLTECGFMDMWRVGDLIEVTYPLSNPESGRIDPTQKLLVLGAVGAAIGLAGAALFWYGAKSRTGPLPI